MFTGALLGYLWGWIWGWSLFDPNRDLYALPPGLARLRGLRLGLLHPSGGMTFCYFARPSDSF
jgi:hypothetical protein